MFAVFPRGADPKSKIIRVLNVHEYCRRLWKVDRGESKHVSTFLAEDQGNRSLSNVHLRHPRMNCEA